LALSINEEPRFLLESGVLVFYCAVISALLIVPLPFSRKTRGNVK
jgi:hypothetical protein